jgi:hypothetical protein
MYLIFKNGLTILYTMLGMTLTVSDEVYMFKIPFAVSSIYLCYLLYQYIYGFLKGVKGGINRK